MKPRRSVLVLSAVLACGWAGSGVGQEQRSPLQILKDGFKTAKEGFKTALAPTTGAPSATQAASRSRTTE
jgi:hypothetical protein